MTRDEHDAILREEIDAAHSRARARLERAATVLTIAGGPAGGAYADTLRALEVRAFAAKIALDPIVTEGSVANIRQLYDGRAQFALVQNDVARNAFAGRGRFAGAPQPELRAVASLFPEAVHLVVGAKSGITGVADLKGKRVELGPDGSGTRANALAILNVNGIAVETLAAAGRAPLAEAAQALADGKVDALFATIHAPARELQRLAARTPVSLVPIGPSRELLDAGLAPLTLPAAHLQRPGCAGADPRRNGAAGDARERPGPRGRRHAQAAVRRPRRRRHRGGRAHRAANRACRRVAAVASGGRRVAGCSGHARPGVGARRAPARRRPLRGRPRRNPTGNDRPE